MDVGRPIACPLICAFWVFAYRVKSGIFKESVAQKPTIPVSAGKKKFQNSYWLQILKVEIISAQTISGMRLPRTIMPMLQPEERML